MHCLHIGPDHHTSDLFEEEEREGGQAGFDKSNPYSLRQIICQCISDGNGMRVLVGKSDVVGACTL
ncbi:MAG: hypothetical protein AB1502_05350 [Thermodesulfobacteriota bacterium]